MQCRYTPLLALVESRYPRVVTAGIAEIAEREGKWSRAFLSGNGEGIVMKSSVFAARSAAGNGCRSGSVAALLAMFAASSAYGQNTYEWVNPAGGLWNMAANWAPAAVPNDIYGTAVLGLSTPYTVSRVPMYGEIYGLSVLNPGATLRFEGNSAVDQNVLHTHGGGILNHGVIQVGTGGGADLKGAVIYLAHGSSVSGSGTIRLVHKSAELQVVGGPRPAFYNEAGHVLAGAGTIEDVHNRGEIVADIPGERLQVSCVNEGTIRVKNGAEASVSVNGEGSEPGTYIVEGPNGVLSGGVSHGEIIASGHPRISASLSDMVSSSTFTLSGSLGGEVRNDGEIHVLSVVRLNDVHILGDGVIVLGRDNAMLRYDGQEKSIIGAGQLVRGEGEIWGPAGTQPERLLNSGVIRADVQGKQLRVESFRNDGVLEARDGGELRIGGSATRPLDNRGVIAALPGAIVRFEAEGMVEQRDGGRMYAEGGTIQCDRDSSYVRGGSISTLGDGLIDVSRRLLLQDVEIGGNWNVRGPLVIQWGSTVRNTTTLRSLDPSSSPMQIQISNGGRIEGVGEMILGHADHARISAGAPLHPATIGRDQTIRGVGRFGSFSATGTLNIEGTIKPGLPIGAIGVDQRVTLADSAVLEVELSGNEHDRINVQSELVLGGKLRVVSLGALPEPCSEYRIITTQGIGKITGTFAELDLPQMPVGRLMVRHDLDAVTLLYNPADHDGSTFVDTDDFTAFMADFEAGSDAADINHSGAVDGEDFADFVAAFEQGC